MAADNDTTGDEKAADWNSNAGSHDPNLGVSTLVKNAIHPTISKLSIQ